MTDTDLQLLCRSSNDVSVYYDPVASHVATHLQDTPNLKSLVVEIIKQLELAGEKIATFVDMGRVVGLCDMVDVQPGDELIWAVRKNRQDDGLVPFVTSRQPEPSSHVTVMLDPHRDGDYILFSAWVGIINPEHQPFPQSARATDKSVDYWRKHAFIYGDEAIIRGTETTIAPW